MREENETQTMLPGSSGDDLLWVSSAPTRDSIRTSFSSNCSRNVKEEQWGSWETERRTKKHISMIRENMFVYDASKSAFVLPFALIVVVATTIQSQINLYYNGIRVLVWRENNNN